MLQANSTKEITRTPTKFEWKTVDQQYCSNKSDFSTIYKNINLNWIQDTT